MVENGLEVCEGVNHRYVEAMFRIAIHATKLANLQKDPKVRFKKIIIAQKSSNVELVF